MALGLKNLFMLKEDVIFLNHGSYGACPKKVFNTYQQWQRELEKQPVEFLSEHRGFKDRLANVRKQLAKTVGTSEDRLVCVMNATTGLNVVARSLPLEKGDEILTSNQEYGALKKTWGFICKKTGARLIHQKIPVPLESEEQFTEAVWAGVTSKTRVIFLSHITSETALLFPINTLIKKAREEGIWTIIDGAHAPGHIPLELDILDVDFYSGNCHKWMLTPKGSAFLFVHPRVQHLIEPLTVSHGWNPDSDSYGALGDSTFIDNIQYQGTRDPAAFLSVPEAIEFMKNNDWSKVQKKCHQLAWESEEELRKWTRLSPLTSSEMRGGLQMVALPIPNCDPVLLHDELYRQFKIEIPITSSGNQMFARISVQGYNTPEDVSKLVFALKKLVPECN